MNGIQLHPTATRRPKLRSPSIQLQRWSCLAKLTLAAAWALQAVNRMAESEDSPPKPFTGPSNASPPTQASHCLPQACRLTWSFAAYEASLSFPDATCPFLPFLERTFELSLPGDLRPPVPRLHCAGRRSRHCCDSQPGQRCHDLLSENPTLNPVPASPPFPPPPSPLPSPLPPACRRAGAKNKFVQNVSFKTFVQNFRSKRFV